MRLHNRPFLGGKAMKTTCVSIQNLPAFVDEIMPTNDYVRLGGTSGSGDNAI